MQVKNRALFTLTGGLFALLTVVAAVPPRPLAIPRPNSANAPPAPGGRPNLRDLGSELIQGGIEQFASAAFAPDTSIFATPSVGTRTTVRASSSGAFDVFGTATSDAFDIWATTTSNAFNIWASTTSDAFDVWSQPTSTTANAFDIGWSTSTGGIFPRTTSPASDTTFIPSCPRAELYIDYCAAWYGNDWATATIQAYCLCYGPESTPSTGQPSSAPTSLVWVPDLFDRDAQDCHNAYGEAIQYWSDIYNGDSEFAGDPRVAAAWNDSIRFEQAWGEAGSFCNGAGNDLGARMVDPTYFEAQAVVTGTTSAEESPVVSSLESGASNWPQVHLEVAVVGCALLGMMLWL